MRSRASSQEKAIFFGGTGEESGAMISADGRRQPLNPKLKTPTPISQTPYPKPPTPNPKHQTPNPKPQTPNPKPQTPYPKSQNFNATP